MNRAPSAVAETSDPRQLGARVRKWAAVTSPVLLGAGAGDPCPKRDLRSRTSPDPANATEISAGT